MTENGEQGPSDGSNKNKGRRFSSRSGQSRNNHGNKTNKNRFTGETEQLKHHTYFIGGAKQASSYITTTDAIISYIRREFDEGDDMAKALKELKEFDFDTVKPKMPTTEQSTTLDEYILKGEVERYLKRKDKYRTNKTKAYEVIIGQCTKGLKNKLEARKDWSSVQYDPIAVLKAIQELVYNYQDSKYPAVSIVKAIKALVNVKQEDGESLSDYIKKFNTTKDLFETQVGVMELGKWIAQDNNKYQMLVTDARKPLIKEYFDKMLAYIFITGCEMNKAEKLVEDLSNDYAKSSKEQRAMVYPKTVQAAAELVTNYRNYVNTSKPKANSNSDKNKQEQKASFAQGRGSSNRDYSNYKCFKCGEMGHIAPYCKKTTETSNVQQQATTEETKTEEKNTTETTTNAQTHKGWNSCQAAISLSQDDVISKKWLLLDNESSTHIVCLPELLTDIKETDEELELQTNGGVLKTKKKGYMHGIGWVWYSPEAITNVLSMALVEDLYRITYDSNVEQAFTVHIDEFQKIKFHRKNQLYIKKLKSAQDYKFCMVQTVQENKHFYTPRQIERAKLARMLYQAIGFPSIQDYKAVIKMNVIKNCPVTLDDIIIAERVFGKDVSALKGKTTRSKPVPVVKDYIEIPMELKETHALRAKILVDSVFVWL